MAHDEAPGVTFHDLSAGGEVGRLIREKDWAATPLGARETWPRSLSNYLSMILELPTAAIVFWGPDRIQLYNDGYAVIMGPRHPKYLGATFQECWPEAYTTIDPWMQRVLVKGETVGVKGTLVPLTRYGFTEEAYFTFSFSPLRDDEGRIAGILQLVTEVTDTVLWERRATVLHTLANQFALAHTTDDAIRLASDTLSGCTADLPFVLLYLPDPAVPDRYVLSGSTAPPEGGQSFPAQFDLRVGSDGPPELVRSVRDRTLVVVEDVATRSGSPPGGPLSEHPRFAVALPVAAADQKSVAALLVAGLSPRLRWEQRYRRFVELVSAQVATMMAAARAYAEERKRAETLAELDRAKIEFFSNVSHEFRTPLTLILGPLEDALSGPSKALHGEGLHAVHRSALRLLRLVNSLLDFARFEGNRLGSALEPTDLPTLTAGLAGSFHSLLASAGLRLVVDCPPLAETVDVDPTQWEKVVLNLLSNAFKFTFEGQITVRLHEEAGSIHLLVSDTGIGIPAGELANIFVRFHRIPGARGRSFEGTGIGLALVHELVKQREGTVGVESVEGKGTTFTVSIPRRTSLSRTPGAGTTAGAPRTDCAAYVLEASHWTTAGPSVEEPPRPRARSRRRVLVADDNADMREYIVRLLQSHWTIETAEDGQAAFDAAVRQPPDLILSDIMMPRMDGIALVRALRANPATSTIPIVLLSARAGEDAVAGGIETGADDYLVKPFAARELLARVQTHIEMARARRKWALDLERANKELEAFSYSVAHDLRAPLRAVSGYSAALLEDWGAKLEGDAKKYLDRIGEGATRMELLIDALLGLSRVNRAELHRARLNLSEMADTIVGHLRDGDPGRKVECVVARDVAAEADPQLTRALLDNLFGNAWKFTSKTLTPRVEFGHDESGSYFVRDNGAGFDMGYAAKLFAPFQRFHTQDEFPGTGIGLATVHRIVRRHGGRIWAEAGPGRGATFRFTLRSDRDDEA